MKIYADIVNRVTMDYRNYLLKNRHILKDNSMMKIVLLKKEYIGLYIYTKFCSHILRPTMCEIPPVYGNNKQQIIESFMKD